MTKERKDSALIFSLCKDIARHASQLEAEVNRNTQSITRYLELKSILTSHYIQGEENFKTVLEEIRKSLCRAADLTASEELTISIKNHVMCMFEYFLMLTYEMSKEN